MRAYSKESATMQAIRAAAESKGSLVFTKCSRTGANTIHQLAKTMHTTKLKAGDKLFFVPNGGHGNYSTVMKVGRTWYTLTNGYRVDIATMAVEGAGRGWSVPGKVYPSQTAYDIERQTNRAWSTLCYDMEKHYRIAPAGMTIERIAEARKLLGV